jgi:hypothetical protein
VTVSQGASCNGGCAGCTDSSCAFIHVQTANFSGTVTCTDDSSNGHAGWLSFTMGGNAARDAPNYYGYPNTTVTATCNGVTGSYTWP